MRKHSNKHYSQYSAKQLFELVKNIEAYPEFLPWISDLKIHQQTENKIIAEVKVKFRAIATSYVSDITLFTPSDNINNNEEGGIKNINNINNGEACDAGNATPNGGYKIEVRQKQGPFKKLYTKWQFNENSSNFNNTAPSAPSPLAGSTNCSGSHHKGSVTDFHIEFQFRSKFFESIIGLLYERAVKKMVTAFEERAKQIYGDKFISSR